MNNIKWKDGAVCFATKEQRYANDDAEYIVSNADKTVSFNSSRAISSHDFQLNEIRQGDYIEASELGTEKKYNDAVVEFELFGFTFDPSKSAHPTDFNAIIKDSFGVHLYVSEIGFLRSGNLFGSGRKITYSQLMAIGKLKRAMIEREHLLNYGKHGEKSAPKIAPDLTPDVVNKPSHYQFFEGVEVIGIIASSMTCEQFKGYCLGNRIKYRLRAGNKDDIAQEIAKSDKYVELYDEHKHLCK